MELFCCMDSITSQIVDLLNVDIATVKGPTVASERSNWVSLRKTLDCLPFLKAFVASAVVGAIAIRVLVVVVASMVVDATLFSIALGVGMVRCGSFSLRFPRHGQKRLVSLCLPWQLNACPFVWSMQVLILPLKSASLNLSTSAGTIDGWSYY